MIPLNAQEIRHAVESALAEDIWGLGNGRLTMQAFLERHGYYGPNEGMVWTSS